MNKDKTKEQLINELNDLRKSEEKYKRLEEKYRMLFQNMLGGFAYHKIVTDENGKAIDYIFMEINDAFEELTGLKREKIIGKKVTEVLPGTENDPADWIGKYGEVALSGKELRFEQYSEPLDRWYSVNSFCPKKGYFATIFADITERKQAEEKLKESEENFRIFFETMDDMIMIGNKEGEIFYTNPAVTKKLGYSEDELQGMHILDVHPKNKRKEAEQIFGEMVAGNRDASPPLLVSKNGSFVPVETRAWHGKWDGKDCFFGIFKDLSVQQEALQKFNKMFDSNPAMMAVSESPDRKFTEVNAAFLHTLGFSKEEIIGNTAADLDLFVEPEKQKQIGAALQKNGKIHNIELKVKAKNGSILTGLFSGEIIESQGKQYFLTVMTDITDLKQAEEELTETNKSLEEATARANSMAAEAERANAAKSEFLANMSHEIRTPMNSVIGFSELLQGTDLNKIQKQYVYTIVSSGKGLLGIINNILDFSKIEAGKLDLEIIQTDLIDMVEQTVDLIEYPASKKGIELLLDIDPELPGFAMVDPVRLRQILANLLSNALKFTEKGEIELKASLLKKEGNHGQIKFSVRDTGIGISDAQKEKLFKAFSQADTSTTREYGGTGLGLVISDQLAQKMGGKLEVDSVQGEGSEFYFTIDTELSEEEINIKAEADEKEIIAENTEEESYTILIAEDNPNNMLFITTLLKQILPGAKIIEAGNGKEAVEKITNLQPDLVFMDVKMPEMDGNEATSELRKRETKENKSHTVVVGLTAGALKQEKDKSLESGMDDFLTKPVETDKLKAVLNKYLKKENTQVDNAQEDNKNGDGENPSISRKEHFDREELFEMIGRDKGVLNELISIFIGNTKNRINDLEALLEKNSFEEAAKTAHSMKGSSANMRCDTFSDLTKQIEREILAEDSEAADKILQDIKDEWEILLPILKDSIERKTGE